MPMGPDERITAALAELKCRLVTRFDDRLARVVLFGSHARGEARPDSDIDVLVVVAGLTPRERSEVHGIAADVWMDLGGRDYVSALALSTDEYARLERLERLIAQDIAREGVPL
jgi:predicted nucleotidyltransferase